MYITYVKDYDTLSEQAAHIVAHYVVQGGKNIALPTGSTPLGLYRELIAANLDWRTTRTFNLDDYVDCEYEHSFHYYMCKNLFSKINIPMEKVYFPPVEEEFSLISNYDYHIWNFGGLDLTVLGLGMNGHIAYNEPGSNFEGETHVAKLSESTRRELITAFGSIDAVPQLATTMGLGTIISESRRILLLVSGSHKLDMLKRSLWGEVTTQVPASILQRHSDVTVLYCD
jgi:glucosamine-6-phosphate deaminase